MQGNPRSFLKLRAFLMTLTIPENTAIKCSLDRRFISDLAGKLVCTINEDVYSANRNVKLIEREQPHI